MSDLLPKGSAPASIAAHFADLPDPRVERTRHHALLEIITIAILAVICGADSWDGCVSHPAPATPGFPEDFDTGARGTSLGVSFRACRAEATLKIPEKRSVRT